MIRCFTHVTWFFFFTVPAPTEIYTLSLHDALPIWRKDDVASPVSAATQRSRATGKMDAQLFGRAARKVGDRKSTRLNSSHVAISYAVFCLKKKKTQRSTYITLITRTTHLTSPATSS